jgi:type III restriction enzyme
VTNTVDVFIQKSINIPKVVLVRHDDVPVTPGFTILRPQNYLIPKDASHRDFRFTLDERLYSRGLLFRGFKRCLSASQQFHSEAERRFAVLLEDFNDPTVVKWIKPEQGIFQIYEEEDNDAPYQPDFLVETKTSKLICDLRNHHQMRQSEVRRASEPAAQWCEYATEQEKQNGGKPWSYLLIPEYAVKDRPSWALWRTQLKIESPTRFELLFG